MREASSGLWGKHLPVMREASPGGLPEAQNIDFSKMLGMASPGVENVPTSLETIFKLSRGP